MNPKVKSALVLVVTLIVGGVLGALIASRAINDRLEKIRDMRSRGGFSEALEAAVQPNSDLQREQLQAILTRSRARLDSINAEWRSEIHENSDLLRADLDSILEPEQSERVQKFFEGNRKHNNSDRNDKSEKSDKSDNDGKSRDRD